LNFGDSIFARQVNSAISWYFSWLFYPTLHTIRHPTSLILCRLCKSVIAGAIDDGRPTGGEASVWPVVHFIFHPIYSLRSSCLPSHPASLAPPTSSGASPPPGRSGNRLGQISQPQVIPQRRPDQAGKKWTFGRVLNGIDYGW
jgi:hypothetical protein